MKQKDIALILVISFIGLLMGVVVSNAVFGGAKNKKLTADKVIAITPDFQQPDKKYFNSSSIDPTQIIHIGENTNQKPFNQ
jgi:hypothetical protein